MPAAQSRVPARFTLRYTTSSNAGKNFYSDSVGAGYNGKRGAVVIINAGVTLGAPDAGTPAARRGTFPAGVIPYLRNLGTIAGFGGAGGSGGNDTAGSAGSAGGSALHSSDGTMVVDNQGTIEGGGGGGGGGGGDEV